MFLRILKRKSDPQLEIFSKSTAEKYPNTEFFLIRIQLKDGKIWTRKNFAFGYFSRSVAVKEQ